MVNENTLVLRIALRETLLEKNIEQLTTFIHDFGVSPDSLPSQTKNTFALEFVAHCQRRDWLGGLEERLGLEILDDLNQRFSMSELQTICFDEGVSYEDFPHQTKQDIATTLISQVRWPKLVRAYKIYRRNTRFDGGQRP